VLYLRYFVGGSLLKQQSGYQWQTMANKHQKPLFRGRVLCGGGSVLIDCLLIDCLLFSWVRALLKQQNGYQWLPMANKRRKPLFRGCCFAKTAKRLPLATNGKRKA
jgi:hypothetical protein